MNNRPKNGVISEVITAKKADKFEVDLSQFQQSNEISPADILAEVGSTQKAFKAVPHQEVLDKLIEYIPRINFKERVYSGYTKLKKKFDALTKKATNSEGKVDEEYKEELKILKEQLEKKKLFRKHYIVEAVEIVIEMAVKHNWGLCKCQDFIYLYNGAYWDLLEEDELKSFIGKAGEKMGIDKYDARYYQFQDALLKQFLGAAHLPVPKKPKNKVLINLMNGTFEITTKGGKLSNFNRQDFLTYQLPFEYNPDATAPLFEKYLSTVQPDTDRQNILAEYLAYVFTRHLRLEKTLLLYGTGANGKSVFFEIVSALFGKKNVTNYSLQSLTDEKGYQRAKIANVLVNYASEINGKLETDIFKQLVSGEPVEARLPYGNPMIIDNYARLIFNCNELPKEVEHNNAFFRRFLIVPFDVTIPVDEQDKELANKIIDAELSGVFNWMLQGLERLLKQKRFSTSEAVENQLKAFCVQSNTVHLFLEEEGYQTSLESFIPTTELYQIFNKFCTDNGFRTTSSRTFYARLENLGYERKRKNKGNIFFIEKK